MTQRSKTSKRGFTDADLADVRDFPDSTDEDLARAKPFAHVLPQQAAAIRRMRGPQKAPLKTSISLRVDPDVLDHFKAGGSGWQSRMNEALRKSAGL